MFGIPRRRLLVGVAAALALATTAACSSTGGAQSADAPTSTTSKRLTIAMISHAPEGDAFFDVIKNGAQDAADKDNVEFKYSSSGEIPQQATFIQNAIDSKVDGIAVSLPNPAALAPVVQKAVAAGIPVVAFNAGDKDWQKTGALAFYGEPEVLAGEFAGTQLTTMGMKHVLVVIQAQGQVQLEDRYTGIASTFSGTTEKLYAQGNDIPTYTSTVSAKLTQDPTIDAVVTLGPQLGVAVAQQVRETGSKVKVVSYAFNKDLLPLLQNGEVSFTIDQQPYLQGYLSIDSLWLYIKNRSVIGAQQPVPTGPVVVDQKNVESILPFVKDGLR
jgi:simple sugar transport system substrate-binding protein